MNNRVTGFTAHPSDYYEITAQLSVGAIGGGSMALLEVRQLHIAYDRRPVVEDVSFAVEPGEILGVARRVRQRQKHHSPGGAGAAAPRRRGYRGNYGF